MEREASAERERNQPVRRSYAILFFPQESEQM